MKAVEFRSVLEELGINQRELADEIEVSPLTVCRWANGKVAIPGSVKAYLRLKIELKNLVGVMRERKRCLTKL